MSCPKLKLPWSSRICLLFLLISLWGCKDDFAPDIKPSEFPKAQRESIGDQIQVEIARQPDVFPVLPNVPPYDTTVYFYLQTLYNQLNTEIRLDRSAPATDRWQADRTWLVTVLDLPEQNAFIVPGGHFYITTGLLRTLEKEYELYYLLAFEISLMNNRYLLNRLITEYNTATLDNLANGKRNPDDVDIRSMVRLIDQLEFEPTQVREIDALTAELICSTSIMDRTGIVSMLELDNPPEAWLTYRSDYPLRTSYVMDEIDVDGESCGSFRSNGGYQRFVLNALK